MGQEQSRAAGSDESSRMPGTLKDSNDPPQAIATKEPTPRVSVPLSEGRTVQYPEARSTPPRSSVLQKRRLEDDDEGHYRSPGRHWSPPRLSRTFQRDEESPENRPRRDAGRASLQQERRRDYNDPPLNRRQYYDGYHGHSPSPPSRRSYSRRSPSPLIRQPSYEHYSGRRRSYSPERRLPPSSVRSRPSLSSPFQATADDPPSMKDARGQSINGGRPMYRNLSWTAAKAGLSEQASTGPVKDALSSIVMSTSSGNPPRLEERARVDFNGLKAVPTGPKPSNKPIGPSPMDANGDRPKPNIRPLPRVDPAVREAPHIFVSASFLPPHPATIRHLIGLLKAYQPKAAFVDNAGYYIVFHESSMGHDRLDACIRYKDQCKLFGQYTIKMEAFQDGQSTYEQSDDPGSELADKLKRRNDVSSHESTAMDSEAQKAPAIAASLTPSATNQLAKGQIFRSSSPLRVPPRHDGDDASSISGKTTSSDLSTSNRSKCHVCNLAPTLEADGLVQCTTCPRRYHKRCHLSPPILLDSEGKDSWQCRRCVRKRVEPRAPQPDKAVNTQKVPYVPSPLLEKDEPPAKRARLDELREQADAVADGMPRGPSQETGRLQGAETTPRPLPDFQGPSEQDPASGGATAEGTADRSGTLSQESSRIHDQAAKPVGDAAGKVPTQSHSNPNERETVSDHVDEADQLVEESFAAPDIPQRDTPKQPTKLNLVRRKIIRSEQTDLEPNADERNCPLPAQTSVSGSLSSTTTQTTTTQATSGAATENTALRPLRPIAIPDPGSASDHSIKNREAEPEVPETPRVQKDSRLRPIAGGLTEARVETSAVPNGHLIKPAVTDSIGSASPADNVVQGEKDGTRDGPPKAVAKRTKKVLVKCEQCRKARTWVLAHVGHGLCGQCQRGRSAQAANEKPEPTSAAVSTDGEVSNVTATESVLPPSILKTPSQTLLVMSGKPTRQVDTDLRATAASPPTTTTDNLGDSQCHHQKGLAAATDVQASERAKAADRARSTDKPVSGQPRSGTGTEAAALQPAPKDGQRKTSSLEQEQSKARSTNNLSMLKSAAKSKLAAQPSPTGQNSDAGHRNDTNASRPVEIVEDPLDFWNDTREQTPSTSTAAGQPGSHALEPPASRQKQINPLEIDQSDRLSTPPPLSPVLGDERGRRLLQTASGSECGRVTPTEHSAEPPMPPNKGTGLGSGKRKCRDRTTFTSQSDLPQRPKCTYDDLICFALCEAPGHRLQARSVFHWIANNIPGYNIGADPWLDRISMTLSDSCGKNKRLYIQEQVKEGDENLLGTECWWKLRSGLAEKLDRWDPVLKQPVSPPRGWQKIAAASRASDDEAEDELPTKPRRAGKRAVAERGAALSIKGVTIKGVNPFQCNGAQTRRSKAAVSSGADPEQDQAVDHISVDTPNSGTADQEGAMDGVIDGETQKVGALSSDEEPLANLHRSMSAHFPPRAATMQSATDTRDAVEDQTMEDLEPEAVAQPKDDTFEVPEREKANHRANGFKWLQPTTKLLRVDHGQTGNLPLAQLVKIEAENIDYTAKSLFNEWPEYDPKNQLNKRAKIEEIKKRPTRKQMFKMPAIYSRLGSNTASIGNSDRNDAADDGDSDARGPSERVSRSPKKQHAYSNLPALEAKVRECETMEEFFDMPANPIPVWRDKQLAYRDGTRDKHGKLPRAGVHYVV